MQVKAESSETQEEQDGLAGGVVDDDQPVEGCRRQAPRPHLAQAAEASHHSRTQPQPASRLCSAAFAVLGACRISPQRRLLCRCGWRSGPAGPAACALQLCSS